MASRWAPLITRRTDRIVDNKTIPAPQPFIIPDYRPKTHLTALLLRTRLPCDLIPHVLDLARYWRPVAEVDTNEQSTVTKERSPYVYLDWDIPRSVMPGSVRRIRIKTDTKDPGWSWNSSAESGVYQDSWTCITLRIINANKEMVKVGDRSEFVIIRNVHAEGRWREHVVVWDWWEGQLESEVDEEARGDKHSPEEIRMALSMLRPGWRVELVVHAKFGAWPNSIRYGMMSFWASSIRKMP